MVFEFNPAYQNIGLGISVKDSPSRPGLRKTSRRAWTRGRDPSYAEPEGRAGCQNPQTRRPSEFEKMARPAVLDRPPA